MNDSDFLKQQNIINNDHKIDIRNMVNSAISPINTASKMSNDMKSSANFKPIPYISTYIPYTDIKPPDNKDAFVESLLQEDYPFVIQRSKRNLVLSKRMEKLLKKYYETRVNKFSFSTTVTTDTTSSKYDSIKSISEDSHHSSKDHSLNTSQRYAKERNYSQLILQQFLKETPINFNYNMYQPQMYSNDQDDGNFLTDINNLSYMFNENKIDPKINGENFVVNKNNAFQFMRHFKQLNSINIENRNILNRNKLWLPMVKKTMDDFFHDNLHIVTPSLKNDTVGDNIDPTTKLNYSKPTWMAQINKLSKSNDNLSNENITTDDMEEIDDDLNIPVHEYVGSISNPTKTYTRTLSKIDFNSTILNTTYMPSVFSEEKFPSTVYHCSVGLGDESFLIGGLMPCYKYNEEAPNLEDFIVDGIDYLPPPLLDNITNNPSMIMNPNFYSISHTTNYVTKLKVSGNIPPPLLCATGSVLSDRYILYFGGFEIKTESTFDTKTNKFHIKKRAFINNVGYILDTVSYEFSKLEILLSSETDNIGFEKLTNFSPRFGHVQVSIKNKNTTTNSKTTKSGKDNDSFFSSQDSSLNSSSNNGNIINSSMNNNNSSSPGSNSNNNNGNGNNLSVNSIILFGGYRQVNDDEYEAMNDIWQIDVPIVSKGKMNYIKFSITAVAKLIGSEETDTSGAIWPSKRAFMASYLYHGIPELNYKHLENELLNKLDSNFAEYNKQVKKKESSDINKDFKNQCPINPNDLEFDSFDMSSLLNDNENLSLIIHGGSNNLQLLDDMWYFDLTNYKWVRINLFGKTFDEDKNCTLHQINLKLTSHSLLVRGNLLLIMGGMNQRDVDILSDLTKENSSKEAEYLKNGTLRLDDLPIISFDLFSRTLLEGELYIDDSDPMMPESDKTRVKLNRRLHLPLINSYIGTHFLMVDNRLTLINGLLAPRITNRDLYLRGTVVYLIIPTLRFTL